MARAAKTQTQEPKVSASTEVISWEKEMEEQAKIAAGMEANTGGASRFSIKAGVLSINDMPIPGNMIGAVIVDSILENAFYEGEYDPENVTPPTCFALSRDDATMAPHEVVVEKGQEQSEKCRGCPMNAFGTADRGKGKACKNRRRLMLINAGEFDANGNFKPFEDVEHFTNTQPALMSLPPTSVGGYATFVKQIAGTLKLPPHGIFTKITVRPDPKTQVRVIFEPIGRIPNELMPVMINRNKEVKPQIEQPYNLDVEEREVKPARGKPVKNVRPEVKRSGAKKY